jgi:hypothetical protein
VYEVAPVTPDQATLVDPVVATKAGTGAAGVASGFRAADAADAGELPTVFAATTFQMSETAVHVENVHVTEVMAPDATVTTPVVALSVMPVARPEAVLTHCVVPSE